MVNPASKLIRSINFVSAQLPVKKYPLPPSLEVVQASFRAMKAPTAASKPINESSVLLKDLHPLDPAAQKKVFFVQETTPKEPETNTMVSIAGGVGEVAQTVLNPSPDLERIPLTTSGVREAFSARRERQRLPSIFGGTPTTPLLPEVQSTPFSVSSFTAASAGLTNESRGGTLSCGLVSCEEIDQLRNSQDASLLKIWPRIFRVLRNETAGVNSDPLLRIDASADEIRAWLQPLCSEVKKERASAKLNAFDEQQKTNREAMIQHLNTQSLSTQEKRDRLTTFDFQQNCERKESEAFKEVEAIKQALRRPKLLEGIRSLDLSGLELEMIPQELLQLEGLQDLNLSENKIKDLSFFRKFNELQEARRLKLAPQIDHLRSEVLASLDRYASKTMPECVNKELEETRHELRKLESKSYKLRHLSLSNNKIDDVSPLDALNELNFVNLSHNHIQDVSCLKNLRSLSLLYLSHNAIQDIEGFSRLVGLQGLDLSHNQIQDVTPLGEIERLSYLILADNQVTEIEPLRGLVFLRTLNLSRNPQLVIGTEPYIFRHLATLHLSGTGICSLRELSEGLLTAPLEELNLSDNEIEDVSFLQRFPYLERLNISGNPVADRSGLERIKYLTI